MSIKNMKDYYDATAYDTAEEWYTNELMLPFLKRFVSLFNARPRILDAGCGTGCESMRISNLGADVVGVDLSEESIKIARKRNPDCQFELMDLKRLNNSIGVFDGIVSLGVIIHIEDGDLHIIFDNFAKIIKPKGFLFLGFIDGNGFCERRSLLEANGEKFNRSVYLHQPERIKEVSQKSNFDYHAEWFLDKPLGQWKFLVLRQK